MKKKVLIAILTVILLVVGAIFYLNTVYLPTKIRTILISTLEKELNRKIGVESLKYNLFRGIVINNLTIYETAELESKPFITIKEVSFNLLYLPLFKSKTIVIPTIKIDSPQINLIRLKENDWNFSSLTLKPSGKNEFSFFVYKISALRAKIFFTDQTLNPYFSLTIPDINGRINFALPKNLKFNLEAKLSEASTGSILILKGDYNLNKQLLTSSIYLRDINLLQFKPYYNLPFDIKSAIAKEATFQISSQKDKISISSRILTKDIEIDKAPYHIRGNCSLITKFYFEPQNPAKFTFDGTAEINDTTLSGVELLKDINQISGHINFNPKEIKTENLQGIANETLIRVKGRVFNFANLQVEAKIFSSPSLGKLSELFSEQLKDFDFEVEGRSQLILEITGLLNDPTALEITGAGNVSEATLSLPQLLLPLTGINGQIEFDKNSLRWKKLTAEYSGTTYFSEGSLSNFSQPHIEATVGSKSFSLSTKLDIQEKNLTLSQCEGKYLNSQFAFKGGAGLSNRRNPLLDLSGKIRLDLQDLTQLLPSYKSRLSAIKPTGIVNLNTALQGKLNNWKEWQLLVTGDSQQLSLQGLKLNNLVLNYAQQEEAIKNLTLSAQSYGGTVDISANGSLSDDNLPCAISAKLQDIDLAQLKTDTPWKEKPTSGKLLLSTEIQGPLKEKEGLRGSGTLAIKEGNIGEINLLKGLGALLFIPEFERIVFQEIAGDFTIGNGSIYTSNLEVKSNEMSLTGEGSVDFSGNLDFTINTQLNQDLIQNSPSLKKSITKFLSSATGVIAVKLTGNLQNPKYKIIPAAGEIIKKVKEFLLEDILR